MGVTVAGAVMRITPARAGKTVCQHVNMLENADHPRACGENAISVVVILDPHGSPPRVRGKPASSPSQPVEHRITPARAGKTPRQVVARRPLTDHPRACGENSQSYIFH